MKSRRVLGSKAGHAFSHNAFQLRTIRSLRPLHKLGGPARALPSSSNCCGPTRCFHASPSPSSRPWKVAPPTAPSVHPHSSASEPASLPLPEQLRALMRLLTHSVVVCTSTAPASRSPRAMTMSSFTSLALAPGPGPVVSFNVAAPSRTLDALRDSKRFNVHVLAGGPAGARVADWFTRGNDEGRRVFEELAGCGVELVQAQAGSGEEARQAEVVESPVLRGEGVLYVIRCKLLDEPSGGLIRVRDHVIVLGEVVEIIEGSGKGGVPGADDCFGLIYADRRYRQLGSTLARDDTGPQSEDPGSDPKN